MAALLNNGADAPIVAAGPPELSEPQRDKTPGLAGAEGFKDQEKTDSGDCAGSPADRKAIATLTARAALAGHRLVRLADGTWLASRWGHSRSLASVAEVERFLARVGVPA